MFKEKKFKLVLTLILCFMLVFLFSACGGGNSGNTGGGNAPATSGGGDSGRVLQGIGEAVGGVRVDRAWHA